MELSLAWLPFEQTALSRADRLDAEGLLVPVARVEDLIVYKAVAWRDRDRVDVERLLALHAAEIDLAYVRAMVAQFAELLEEPDRLREFDRLVAKTQSEG
jgi:predicted nucleotidyltransferase